MSPNVRSEEREELEGEKGSRFWCTELFRGQELISFIVPIPHSDSVRILLLGLLSIQQAFNFNWRMKKSDVTYFSVNLSDT